jgi:FkbH-like protein
MIAMCSKNDPADIPVIEGLLNVKQIGTLYDVPNPFADEIYPYKDLFVAKKIDWNDKPVNLQALAKELNIGIDSFAFFDDSPFERELVSKSLPKVTVFPEWAIKDALILPQFEPLPLTKEAANRSEMMQAEEQRNADEKGFQGEKEDFLRMCQMKLWIREADDENVNRVFEMIQRTNQLNTTTKRYTLKEVEDFHKSSDYAIYVADLVDKYGEYGTIGLAIVKKEAEAWILDTFLFSCRAMGKTVEKTTVLYILQKAREAGIPFVRGSYIPTEKNQLMEKFFGECNFTQVNSNDENGETVWEFDLSNPIEEYPNWFEFVNQ